MSQIKTFCACLAMSALAFAQQPGCDPGHANARLVINSTVPALGSNDVDLAGSPIITIDVSTSLGSTEDVILILGTLACGALPTPWGGSIDMSAGEVVADGLGLTTGTFLDYLAHTPFSLAASLSGANPPTAVLGTTQAIVTDPTNMPFAFRNTLAIRSTFGVAETVYTLADDDFVQHTLITANPIEFCGVSATQFFVNSNGFVTFNAGSNDFSETLGEFFDGWGSAPNPGVAVAYSDLNRGGLTSGATYAVRESGNGVQVEFRDQIHWSSQEPAGTFSVTFLDSSFSDTRIDLTGFIPATTATDDIIVGVTDGDASVGIDTDLSDGMGTGISSNIGSYTSPLGGPDSIGELIPANTAPGFGTVQFFELGFHGSCRWAITP
ncbi:MAG TPA: hypothetical protein ENK43_06085 [Planctomycetes bacterium]|nr:hypothetical protein [Planctomycetota bacterium]